MSRNSMRRYLKQEKQRKGKYEDECHHFAKDWSLLQSSLSWDMHHVAMLWLPLIMLTVLISG